MLKFVITIGVTGEIAAGKSTVGSLLAARGARVVDADALAHETYAPGTSGFAAVVQAFGPAIIGLDGGVDRAALGRIVFADAAQMRLLTAIVWPLTRARFEAVRREAAGASVEVLAVEAVALREAGWGALCDEVWLVRAPEDAVRQRLTERSLSEADIAARFAAQRAGLAGGEGVSLALENDGDLDSLERLVDAAWQAALARPR